MFGRLKGKSPEQIAAMRPAGLLVAQTLESVAAAAQPGVTLAELDALAESQIRGAGGVPSFLGYPGGPGAPAFTGSLCLSVNDEVVHGLPRSRALERGDILSIDCGAIVDGWHGDGATTIIVGGPEAGDDAARDLLRVTEDSLWAGIAALKVGQRLFAVGDAVEDCVDEAMDNAAAHGLPRTYGILEDYTGHGIGREMHLSPEVYNYRVRDKGPSVPDGLTICIEPMITLGSGETRELDDRWTVVSADGSRAAHFEHTVAVTKQGVWVLTSLDGGRAECAARGIPYAGPAE